MIEKNNYLASNLKYLRISSNKTLSEIADSLDVSITAIHYWENSKREPSIMDVYKISLLYDISIDDLILKDLRFDSKTEKIENNIKLDNNHKLDIAIQDKSKDLSDEDKQILINIMDNIEKLTKK